MNKEIFINCNIFLNLCYFIFNKNYAVFLTYCQIYVIIYLCLFLKNKNMTIKINLSALNKESQAEISDFMKSQETHPNEVIKNEKTLETKTEEIQETNIVKKKISLKDIKKSSNIITKNISQDIEKEEIEGGNSQEIVEVKVEEKQNQEEKNELFLNYK